MFWKKKEEKASRLLKRQREVNARLRRKLRNQKEQLRALNIAILRKNAQIRNMEAEWKPVQKTRTHTGAVSIPSLHTSLSS